MTIKNIVCGYKKLIKDHIIQKLHQIEFVNPKVMKALQSLNSLVLASIVGCLFVNITTVKGQNSRPNHIQNCQQYRDRRGRFELTGNDDSVYCLQQNLYQSALTSSPFNVSIVYVEALLQRALSRCSTFNFLFGRNARQRRKRSCSWERKEVRMLSRSEWRRFTNRLNILKRPVRLLGGNSFIPYDIISDIHRSDVNIDAAHGGPSFLGWHRVYLLLLEAAIGMPVPYWDSRLDYDMTEPTDSVLWSDEFFGPGFGVVDSGPFAGWITADNISLVRNIGSRGSLISDAMFNDILQYTNHDPVVEPTQFPIRSIELIHGGPHVWVDGQLSSLQTASQEPVFFLHHGFVDYIWYVFRKQMREVGNINPASDYPNKGPTSHRPQGHMIPFGNLRNIQGYSDFLESLTRYQTSPTCPSCGRSRYLECDQTINRCKSKTRRQFQNSISLADVSSGRRQPENIVSLADVSSGRRQLENMGPIYLGEKFKSPYTDRRTRGDALRFLPLIPRQTLV
ncbi:putative tyrosinase-like protein tyr-3 [Argopecten irradians]|uniref:putative tyrosinase-like protein tyr-3 n=1 Tax=Argopecten irradians TaxID=31199 RepID=UPI003719C439